MSFRFDRSSGSVNNTNPLDVQCIILRKGDAMKKIKIYRITGKVSVE